MKVWLDGALVDEAQARISPADRGFLLGDGVFETVRSYGGRLPTLHAHLARLAAGAAVIGIQAPPPDRLARAAEEVVAASGLTDARLRITITAGATTAALRRLSGPPTVLISASPLRSWPQTASAIVAPWAHDERSPLAGVKTISRAASVMALELADERGADEALFLNSAANLCEATTANVFVVRDGGVETPSITAGCLPGITRERVLALCQELGVGAAEVDVPLAMLEAADELFLTSSTREVQALVRLDGRAIGDGAPGEVTRALRDAFAARIAAA